MVEYLIRALDDSGTKLGEVDDYAELHYRLRVNHPHSFQIKIHRNRDHSAWLLRNYQLEIERDGVTLLGGRIGKRQPEYDEDGNETNFLVAAGLSDLELLDRRIIVPPSGSTHMACNDNIDDAMKYFVRYNCVTGYVVDADREDSGLSVEADAGAHPTTANLTGRYQILLNWLQKWADYYGVDFDIVRTGAGAYEFRTYYPQLGSDKRTTMVFSIHRGNISSFKWWEDGLAVYNYAYVGGQGEGLERNVRTLSDTNSITENGRRERFVDARDLSSDASLDLRGYEYLTEHGAAIEGVQVKVLDVEGTEWGTHWDLGDLVRAYDPEWEVTHEAKIVAVDVTVKPGQGEIAQPIIGDLPASLTDRLRSSEDWRENAGTGDTPADPVPPAAPTGMTDSSATNQDDQGDWSAILILGWNASTETDLDYYVIQVRRTASADWMTYTTRDTAYEVDGLIPGAAYRARLAAVDKAGNISAWANFNSGSDITLTADTTPPAAPSNVVVTGLFKKVMIEWDDNAELDLAGYEVHLSTSDGFTPAAGTLIYKGSATMVLYEGDVNTTYYVKISAFDRSGNYSGYSTQASDSTADLETNWVEDLAITNAKIGNLAVDEAKIADLAVTNAKIANATIEHAKINTVSADSVTLGSLDPERLAVPPGFVAEGRSLLCHFDGTTAGDRGEVATETGGVIFLGRLGMGEGLAKFDQAVQIGSAQTNLIINPSFGTNTTSWAAVGTGTIARVADEHRYGGYSCKITPGAGLYNGAGYNPNIAVSTTTDYVVALDLIGVAGNEYLIKVSLDSTGAVFSNVITATGDWQRKFVCFTTNGADTLVDYVQVIKNGDANTDVVYIDGVDFIQSRYPVPHIDGSLGPGHSWSGTAHASTSSRTAATLTFDNSVVADPAGNCSDELTILGWFIPFWGATDDITTQASGWECIGADYNNRIMLYFDGSNDTWRLYINGAVRCYSAAQTFSSLDRFLIVATLDFKNDEYNLYIDDQTVVTSTASLSPPAFGTNPFKVGCRGTAAQLQGLVDDFCILKKILSADEISAIYNWGLPLVSPTSPRQVTGGDGAVLINSDGLQFYDLTDVTDPVLTMEMRAEEGDIRFHGTTSRACLIYVDDDSTKYMEVRMDASEARIRAADTGASYPSQTGWKLYLQSASTDRYLGRLWGEYNAVGPVHYAYLEAISPDGNSESRVLATCIDSQPGEVRLGNEDVQYGRMTEFGNRWGGRWNPGFYFHPNQGVSTTGGVGTGAHGPSSCDRQYLSYANGSTNGRAWTGLVDKPISDKDYVIQVWFACTTNTGNVRLRARYSRCMPGENPQTELAVTEIAETFAVPATANDLCYVEFSTTLVMGVSGDTWGGLFTLDMARLGADALDTNAGTVYVYGVALRQATS